MNIQGIYSKIGEKNTFKVYIEQFYQYQMLYEKLKLNYNDWNGPLTELFKALEENKIIVMKADAIGVTYIVKPTAFGLIFLRQQSMGFVPQFTLFSTDEFAQEFPDLGKRAVRGQELHDILFGNLIENKATKKELVQKFEPMEHVDKWVQFLMGQYREYHHDPLLVIGAKFEWEIDNLRDDYDRLFAIAKETGWAIPITNFHGTVETHRDKQRPDPLLAKVSITLNTTFFQDDFLNRFINSTLGPNWRLTSNNDRHLNYGNETAFFLYEEDGGRDSALFVCTGKGYFIIERLVKSGVVEYNVRAPKEYVGIPLQKVIGEQPFFHYVPLTKTLAVQSEEYDLIQPEKEENRQAA